MSDKTIKKILQGKIISTKIMYSSFEYSFDHFCNTNNNAFDIILGIHEAHTVDTRISKDNTRLFADDFPIHWTISEANAHR